MNSNTTAKSMLDKIANGDLDKDITSIFLGSGELKNISKFPV